MSAGAPPRSSAFGAPPPSNAATVAQGTRSPGPSPPRFSPAPLHSDIATGRDGHAGTTPTREPALGYASAPAEGDSDGSMRGQQRAIEAVCARKGMTLLKLVRDVEVVGGLDLSRPGLAYALERLAARDAACLVVSSLGRLSSSAAELGTLLEWLDRCGARLVVVDVDLDTATPDGGRRATALATAGESERGSPRQQTRMGLESGRPAQGTSGPPALSEGPALKERISDMRASGMTLQAIADALNAEGIPTLRGGARWRPSSVQAAVGYRRPNRKREP